MDWSDWLIDSRYYKGMEHKIIFNMSFSYKYIGCSAHVLDTANWLVYLQYSRITFAVDTSREMQHEDTSEDNQNLHLGNKTNILMWLRSIKAIVKQFIKGKVQLVQKNVGIFQKDQSN